MNDRSNREPARFRPIQFSILRMLGLLTFLAFSFAVLFVFPDPLTGLCVWLGTNTMLTFAIIGLVYGSTSTRTFAIGLVIGLTPAAIAVLIYTIALSWQEDFPMSYDQWVSLFAKGGENLRWYAGSWILSVATGIQAYLFRRMLNNRVD